MKPRLSSSTKWTSFPTEFSAQIAEVFQQSFAEDFKRENVSVQRLVIDGRIYAEEINFRVGLLEKGRLKQANFEVSIDLPSVRSQEHLTEKDQTGVIFSEDVTLDSIHTCIDAAGTLLQEYVANDGAVDFPLTWSEEEFNGQTVWIQFSSENTELEAEANRILGLADSQLVNELSGDESQEAMDYAEVLPQEDLEEKQKEFKTRNQGSLH